ncbi:RNA pseudourine synthase 1-like protein [Trifolium pratense]|uniref:RNA pseudourine synthase 1-like protein n=1 Tax=Trifolium pratense TaxID=57577 RepID=A0A2K3NIY2_TRIPR|nr:RNA pseudourine synthase 1-like protein [Trifolium pratense]
MLKQPMWVASGFYSHHHCHFRNPSKLPPKPPSSAIPTVVAMSASHQNKQSHHSETTPTVIENFPIPLSPQLPLISKQIELNRATIATSNSELFTLSKNHIIYEDEFLLAVNKPQGIYCDNVLTSLQSQNPVTAELHLANRLDRDTSGVMLITKSHKVASKLVKAFTDHKVKKTYIALCTGVVPDWKTITVRSGHGRSKFGAWRVYGFSDAGRGLPGGSVVREMETSFEVLSVNGKGSFREVAELGFEGSSLVVVEEKAVKIDGGDDRNEIVVRAYPRSGRTHQIRLHCQYLGISIIGDVKYEGVYEWNGVIHDGHHLHAETLSFDHPVTGVHVMLHAPLPQWANQALQLQP